MAVLLRKRTLAKKHENFFSIISNDKWNFSKIIRDTYQKQQDVVTNFNQKNRID